MKEVRGFSISAKERFLSQRNQYTAVDERVNPVIPSGDGAVRDGAAFSIISRGGEYGGAQGAEVSITGGTFISRHNIAVREYGADNLDTLVKHCISIRGKENS